MADVAPAPRGSSAVDALLAQFPSPPISMPTPKVFEPRVVSRSSRRKHKEFVSELVATQPSPEQLQSLCALVSAHSPAYVHSVMTSALDEASQRASMTRSRNARSLLSFVARKTGFGGGGDDRGDKPKAERDVRLSASVLILQPPATPGSDPAPPGSSGQAGSASTAPTPAPTPAPTSASAPAPAPPPSSSSSSSTPMSPTADVAPTWPPCPAHVVINTSFTLYNVGRAKAQVMLRPQGPVPAHTATVSVDPVSVVVKRGGEAVVAVRVELQRPGTRVCCPIAVSVAGGPSLYTVIAADTEQSVFGVPVSGLEFVSSAGFQVPAVLADLRNFLHAEPSRMAVPWIFRLAPDARLVKRCKGLLNHGQFPDNLTPECAAHLVKIFYRELPVPVLSAVPSEVLLHCTSRADCEAAMDLITGHNRTLLLWLIDLLGDVALVEANKMPAKNLGIVVGPNLFTITNDDNPMEALMLTQKAVTFLVNMISIDVEKKGGVADPPAAAAPAAAPTPLPRVESSTEADGGDEE